MKRTSSLASAALAAIALSAGMFGGTAFTSAAMAEATVSKAVATSAKSLPRVATGSPAEKAAWLRMRGYGLARNSYPRAGWSVRQGQRLARKRRNVARHRAAARRAGSR